MVGLYLLASADIHAPRFLREFREALKEVEKGALAFLLAGDLVDKGKVEFCSAVTSSVSRVLDVPIYAVFGNEEYDEVKGRLVETCGVTWLDDEIAYLEGEGKRVAIVGTRGSLDKPTIWQRRNVPGIERIYSERVERVRALLKEAVRSADFVVLVTHYAPRCKTLEGEDKKIWPYLSSSKLTKVIAEVKPHAVIHGHIHGGTRPLDFIEGVPVYNVSLPAVKRIVKIQLVARGLEAFF